MKRDCEGGDNNRNMKLFSYLIQLCESPFIIPFSLEPDPL